ncbi:unnamed protein product [Larinioides sclopetarius]|uniref:Uncharacterized protein n=1 Tax=Larinioides sclopetarius TaxID=280406 RepID=A0AAV1ZBV8_9ARAC
MLSKTAVVAAGVCGTLFIGYCIYFDRKRRSDPNFKQNLRDRKFLKKLIRVQRNHNELPYRYKKKRKQKFEGPRLQMGEEMLLFSDIENGIEHLSTALAVCGEPQHLIEVLQVQLPPPIFHMLMQRLPIVSQVVSNILFKIFHFK